jgi:hypothetical protein
MKVIILYYGEEEIGVYSSKQKASIAENDLKTLDHYQNDNYYHHVEFELDKFDIEAFNKQKKQTIDNSFLGQIREIIGGSLSIAILLIILTTIVLGIKSCGQIILNLFK